MINIGKKYNLMNSFGENIFKTDCTPALQAFNEKAVSYARIVVNSKVFEEVLWSKMKSLYGKCKGDPYYDYNLTIQYRKVLAACRGFNNVQVACTGGGGNASAGIGVYNLNKTPEFAWSSWLTMQQLRQSLPRCAPMSKETRTPLQAAVGLLIHGPIPRPLV